MGYLISKIFCNCIILNIHINPINKIYHNFINGEITRKQQFSKDYIYVLYELSELEWVIRKLSGSYWIFEWASNDI